MSIRQLCSAATAALLVCCGFATPVAAQVSARAAAVDAYALTTGRLLSVVAALVALAGVVMGGLALARSARGGGGGKRGAIVAMVAGLVGIVVGAVVVGAAEGGPGTGYGIVGGFAAMGIGLIATILGWLALGRARRAPLNA